MRAHDQALYEPGAKDFVAVSGVALCVIRTLLAMGKSTIPPTPSRTHTPAEDAVTAGLARKSAVAVTDEPATTIRGAVAVTDAAALGGAMLTIVATTTVKPMAIARAP
jgi:hypothetical protein